MSDSWRWGRRPGDVYGGGDAKWREIGASLEAWLRESLSRRLAGFAGQYAGEVFALREQAREIAAIRDAAIESGAVVTAVEKTE